MKSNNQIVETDYLKGDRKSIDTQKVIFKIWENERNDDLVDALCKLLSKFVDEKKTFSEIEFFLPQIAHMMIQLPSHHAGLEKLAFLIAQYSMHTAMQLCFILNAAMEDYQPELSNGKKNPNSDPAFFYRCARILQNIERVVIYGSVYISKNEEENLHIHNTGEITVSTKRESIATELSRVKSQDLDGLFNGELYYKRTVRKSMFRSKAWKQRFFVVDQHILLCYHDMHAPFPLRALPLNDCDVVKPAHSKYGLTYFEVMQKSTGTRYQMRATTPEQCSKWVDKLIGEIHKAPPKVLGDEEDERMLEMTKEDMDKEDLHAASAPIRRSIEVYIQNVDDTSLTEVQRKRFHFFRQERKFITNLTDICERLRFKEKEQRKSYLYRDLSSLVIPPFSYLPISSSLDTYGNVISVLPLDAHAFTTKARCPALILFEVEKHPQQLDVASFLGKALEFYSEKDIILPISLTSVEMLHVGDVKVDISINHSHLESKSNGTIAIDEEQDVNVKNGGSRFDLPTSEPSAMIRSTSSQILDAMTTTEWWKPEGTGVMRLNQSQHSTTSSHPGADTVAKSGRHHETDHENAALTSSTTHSNENAEDKSKVTAPGRVPILQSETFEEKIQRIKSESPFGHLKGWTLDGLIAKSNDDLRQEVFVMQLISYYNKVFREAKLNVWMHTYTILSTSKSTGLIQLIPNAISFDGLKKKSTYPGSLRRYYEEEYGYVANQPEPPAFRKAIDAYVASMAAYSVVTYLLAIKDRHNGNVMLDNKGHIIHIDFGFVFGLAPGKAFSMEKAPWKLTKEMAEVMGGLFSPDFIEYSRLCTQCFIAARRHAKPVIALFEIMSYRSNYPAFRYNPKAIEDFKARLYLDLPEQDIEILINKLIHRSYDHRGTNLYDSFQLATNGIAK